MSPLLFTPIFGAIKSLIGAWSDNKKRGAARLKQKDDDRSTKLKSDLHLIESGQEADIIQDTNARGYAGWMDDISFYIMFSPVPLSFFPPAVPHITAGFEVLEGMPVEYQVCVGLMLASIWGYKRLITPLLLGRIKK